jgi:hypothetical protein
MRDIPGAEYYSDRTISLPLCKMTDADADDVIAAAKIIGHYRTAQKCKVQSGK